MKTIIYATPSLYGDHHVVEVRRLLLEMPGVTDVYASSAFHTVEATYDPDKIGEQDIQRKLQETGYLDNLASPVEGDVAVNLQPDASHTFFRHTDVFEASRQVLSFSQTVGYTGRPLWNCPGFGVVKHEKMED